jgi:hypothetical protein
MARVHRGARRRRMLMGPTYATALSGGTPPHFCSFMQRRGKAETPGIQRFPGFPCACSYLTVIVVSADGPYSEWLRSGESADRVTNTEYSPPLGTVGSKGSTRSELPIFLACFVTGSAKVERVPEYGCLRAGGCLRNRRPPSATCGLSGCQDGSETGSCREFFQGERSLPQRAHLID